MTDKDQFIFDEDDDVTEPRREDQQDSPELDAAGDEFPGIDMTGQQESPELDLDKQGLPEISSEEQPPSLELDGSDDGFAESDLSASFADGEHSLDQADEDAPGAGSQDGGNPRLRSLLMILLLVVIGAAGAFYFMDLGGNAPTVPTVSVPAQTDSKAVALPPKTMPEPPAPGQAETAANPASVTVQPPPPPAAVAGPESPQPVTETGPSSAAAEKPDAEKGAVTSSTEPAKPMEQQPATAEQQSAADSQAAAVAKPETTPASPSPAAAAPPEAADATSPEPAPVPKQVANAAYSLDAGSYLFESNRESLVTKIKKLGYDPMISPVDATLDMTRLRLGTYSKDEVQDALAFARTIEPGAYSAQAGDRYIIYAGTFLRSGNVDKLTKRFLDEGVTVHPEPVQVVRTLSRIRFGRFATKEDAAAAAREIKDAGLQVEVVKLK
ncbi:MAG: SPOR domain-containing protein [Desulfuromonadales bacterium]